MSFETHYSIILYSAGVKSRHEETIQFSHGATISAMPQTRKIQETAVCSMLLPRDIAGTEEIQNAWLEHHV